MYVVFSLFLNRHPFFWKGERVLAFFGAVSDQLEKLSEMDESVLRLECGGLKVVRTDWTKHITEELRQDLRRFGFLIYICLSIALKLNCSSVKSTGVLFTLISLEI